MPETKNISNFISLADVSKVTGYNQDYLGFLARTGKLGAQKIGRNWVTTAAAVHELLASGVGQSMEMKVPSNDGFSADVLAAKEAAYRMRDEQHAAAVHAAVDRRLRKFEEDLRANLDSVVSKIVQEKIAGIAPQGSVEKIEGSRQQARSMVFFPRASSALDVSPERIEKNNSLGGGRSLDAGVQKVNQSLKPNSSGARYLALFVAIVVTAAVVGVCYAVLGGGTFKEQLPSPLEIASVQQGSAWQQWQPVAQLEANSPAVPYFSTAQVGDLIAAAVPGDSSELEASQLQANAGSGDLRYVDVAYPTEATYTVSSSSASTTSNLYLGMATVSAVQSLPGAALGGGTGVNTAAALPSPAGVTSSGNVPLSASLPVVGAPMVSPSFGGVGH